MPTDAVELARSHKCHKPTSAGIGGAKLHCERLSPCIGGGLRIGIHHICHHRRERWGFERGEQDCVEAGKPECQREEDSVYFADNLHNVSRGGPQSGGKVKSE
jgi:hypothetical protein